MKHFNYKTLYHKSLYKSPKRFIERLTQIERETVKI